jgi:hypothetical protein
MEDGSIVDPAIPDIRKEIGGNECVVGFDVFSNYSATFRVDHKDCSYFRRVVEHLVAEWLGHCTFGGAFAPLTYQERLAFTFDFNSILSSCPVGPFQFHSFTAGAEDQTIREYAIGAVRCYDGRDVCRLLLMPGRWRLHTDGLLLSPLFLFRSLNYQVDPRAVSVEVKCDFGLNVTTPPAGPPSQLSCTYEDLLTVVGSHGRTIEQDAVALTAMVEAKPHVTRADYNDTVREYMDSFETPYKYRGEDWKGYFRGEIHSCTERYQMVESIIDCLPLTIQPQVCNNDYAASFISYEDYVNDLHEYTTFCEKDLSLSLGRPDLYRLYETFYHCGDMPVRIRGFLVSGEKAGLLLSHFFRYRPVKTDDLKDFCSRDKINYQLFSNWFLYALSDDFCCVLACLLIKLGLFYLTGSQIGTVFSQYDNYILKFSSCPLLGYDLTGLGLSHSLSILSPWEPMEGDNKTAFKNHCKYIANLVGLMNDEHLFRNGADRTPSSGEGSAQWQDDVEHPEWTFDDIPDYSRLNSWPEKHKTGTPKCVGLSLLIAKDFGVDKEPDFDFKKYTVGRNMGCSLVAASHKTGIVSLQLDYMKEVCAPAVGKMISFINSKGNLTSNQYYRSLWHTSSTTGSVVFGDANTTREPIISKFVKHLTFELD